MAGLTERMHSFAIGLMLIIERLEQSTLGAIHISMLTSPNPLSHFEGLWAYINSARAPVCRRISSQHIVHKTISSVEVI
jgi:hypothetical protein